LYTIQKILFIWKVIKTIIDECEIDLIIFL
jgi:hypothetical protein